MPLTVPLGAQPVLPLGAPTEWSHYLVITRETPSMAKHLCDPTLAALSPLPKRKRKSRNGIRRPRLQAMGNR